jgi:hypothetical protein
LPGSFEIQNNPPLTGDLASNGRKVCFGQLQMLLQRGEVHAFVLAQPLNTQLAGHTLIAGCRGFLNLLAATVDVSVRGRACGGLLP